MSRGRLSQKALDVALPVAWSRGFVTLCRREQDCVCDFVIHAAAYTSVVLVQRSRRLHGTMTEMEVQFSEHINRIRLVPQGPARSLELWAASPHGVLRFFRITRTGLAELRRNGDPIAVKG
jgi:hypothetical protein